MLWLFYFMFTFCGSIQLLNSKKNLLGISEEILAIFASYGND